MRTRVAPVTEAITPAGRATLGLGVLAWIVAARANWEELGVIAATAVVAVAVAALFTLGRIQLDIAIELSPKRVVVGDAATARVRVSNSGRRRLLAGRVETPVGEGVARFEVPGLAPGAGWDDLIVIPTARRSVVTLGPSRSVRDDPLGLARREVTCGGSEELFVHPKTVRVGGAASGWLRDLEGRTTNDLSTSDVAFHTLREYVPGDDRRHVHWRTSARNVDGKLMVRQFVDTRRSHLGIVLVTSSALFASDDEFELAVSVAGSLGASALRDGQAVSVASVEHALPAPTPQLLLDGLSGVVASPETQTPEQVVRKALPVMRGVSVVAIVTGSAVDNAVFRSAASRFTADTRVLGVRCGRSSAPAVRRVGTVSVLDIGSLNELDGVIRAAGR